MTTEHLAAAGHPRPQLIRDPNWNDLSGPWGFAYDDTDIGRSERWQHSADPFDRTITVPYPPESKLSGINDTGFHPVVWYRREISTALPVGGRRLLLHFGAVDYHATVWVNGQLVGEHEGGHVGFSLDITDALNTSGTQVITVRAEDRPQDSAQPRGKQDWEAEPHVIWYHRTTGIWQPVWLEEVPALRIETLHWTPDLPACRVRCEIKLNDWPSAPHRLEVELRLGTEILASQSARITGRELHLDIAVPALRHGQDLERLLWSPENPHLVDAAVRLNDSEDAPVDHISSYLGLRSIGTRDGRFLLNTKPYFLSFALEQGYWPQSHLAAPAADLRREVELAKELGLNGIRIHQKIEDPRFLYWCDRLGLLVWEEMPSVYEYGTTAVHRVVAEWTAAIERDRSHPSIMAWVPINESWGVPNLAERAEQRHFATGLYHLTKGLDPSRPAISNDGWEITAGDFWGIHDYHQNPDVLRRRYEHDALRRGDLRELWPNLKRLLLDDPQYTGQPVMLTEFGGATFVPAEGENWFGYGTVTSEDEYAEMLSGLIEACVDSGLAGYCFTQLTDTEQETNGLLTEERRPKLPMERMRAILRRSSHVTGH
ncbi:sugar-binding domain-containing protein [Streptomyces misionensis]|uniref:glycoside hydrolase family 2 protein n=1 Tax=Streptomyces misionensis TaxID=67331 RepID=UPI0033EA5ECF